MTDRTAFAVGVLAIAIAGLALWLHYSTIDWRQVGLLAPVVLVVIGAGMRATMGVISLVWALPRATSTPGPSGSEHA